MLENLIGLIILIIPIALAIWVIETYFPNVRKLVKAFIIASLVIAVLRLFYQWSCSLICGPFIP